MPTYSYFFYRLPYLKSDVCNIQHNSVADPVPGSGAFLTPGSGIRDEHPDHISESLETIFGLKMLQFLDADPESF